MKTLSIKNSSFFALLFFCFSCELLPDLDPNSASGSDIQVFSLDYQTVDFNGKDTEYSGLDLDGNGTLDFEVLALQPRILSCGAFCCTSAEPNVFIKIRSSCEILLGYTEYFNKPIYVSSDQLVSSIQLPSLWQQQTGLYTLLNQSCSDWEPFSPGCDCIDYLNLQVPIGVSYFFLRHSIDGNQYYGWAEINTNFYTGFYGITRVGFATQPGIQLRTGQTGF